MVEKEAPLVWTIDVADNLTPSGTPHHLQDRFSAKRLEVPPSPKDHHQLAAENREAILTARRDRLSRRLQQIELVRQRNKLNRHKNTQGSSCTSPPESRVLKVRICDYSIINQM
eukprot:Colp12_sorted_trinity150504_noHs@9526